MKTAKQLAARYAQDAIYQMAKELSQDKSYENWEFADIKAYAAKKIAEQIGLAYN